MFSRRSRGTQRAGSECGGGSQRAASIRATVREGRCEDICESVPEVEEETHPIIGGACFQLDRGASHAVAALGSRSANDILVESIEDGESPCSAVQQLQGFSTPDTTKGLE